MKTKPAMKAVPFKGKLFHTIILLFPIFMSTLLGNYIGSYLSDDPAKLEQFWIRFPSLLKFQSLAAVVFGVIGILGWYLGDRMQNKN